MIFINQFTNGAETNRRTDSEDEKELALFLDKFYDKVFPGSQRVNDFHSQIKGIDILVKNKEKTIKVDEKGMTGYIGIKGTKYNALPTFSLEISYEKRNMKGERDIGWLINPEKETDAYLFCWCHDSKVLRHPKKNDYKEVEAMLIYRQELLDMLESKGLSVNRINAMNDYILLKAESEENSLKTMRFDEGCYRFKNHNAHFVYSGRIAEAPINLVLKKEEYAQLPSTRTWIVTPKFIRETTENHKRFYCVA